MARVLAIGDVHAPVAHPGYLPFCQDLYRRHRCDTVIFVGDVVDWHGVSFHARSPEAPGPKDEYELALVCIKKWAEAFPVARVCIGNHDERLIRLAETVNIPAKFLRDYTEIWETPKWKWDYEHIIDDVYYFHGTGTGGYHPAYNSMKKMLMSVVQGHCHAAAGIKWAANPMRRIFGMDTGCGIDDKAYAFAYGRHQKVRSVLGAGVILDGVPYHEIMQIGDGETYHRSRFPAKENENASAEVVAEQDGRVRREAVVRGDRMGAGRCDGTPDDRMQRPTQSAAGQHSGQHARRGNGNRQGKGSCRVGGRPGKAVDSRGEPDRKGTAGRGCR